MQAEFEDYSNRIKLNDWDGLYAECLKLKRENMEMHVRDEEYKRWSEKFKAWQHGKLMDNKAFSLNSDEKPYYRSSKAEQPHEESQAAG